MGKLDSERFPAGIPSVDPKLRTGEHRPKLVNFSPNGFFIFFVVSCRMTRLKGHVLIAASRYAGVASPSAEVLAEDGSVLKLSFRWTGVIDKFAGVAQG